MPDCTGTLGTTEIQTAAIKEVEVLWLEWDLDSVKLIVYNLNMDHAHSVIFIYDPGTHILKQGTTCKNVTFSNWQNYGNDGKCSKKVHNDSIVGPIFVTGHALGLTCCPVIPGSHDTRTLCGHQVLWLQLWPGSRTANISVRTQLWLREKYTCVKTSDMDSKLIEFGHGAGR